jgi:2-keto-4-pentenoate hydratase/2-oxohepta-3-ene-1,7-dioic acid hydratase in catechol pathway
MRFATFAYGGQVHTGVVTDAATLRLLPVGSTIQGLVQRGLPGLLEAGAQAPGPEVALAEVRLLPPLQPPSIRDFVAFEEHEEGVVRSGSGTAVVVDEWYAAPTFYFSNPHTLIGAHDDVAVPPGCALLDFELEVAAVLGREGRTLDLTAAHESIVGYTIFNDWSARDLQRAEMRIGLGPAKGKDFASTLGPWLVTADEFVDRHDREGFLTLEMTVSVNDEIVGEDLLSNMGWPFAELVAYASRGSLVRPGDVLGSGTCGNGGCLAELWGRSGTRQPPPLQPGDVVTMTVEGIGTLRNRVVEGPDAAEVPRARSRPRNRHATAG